MPDILETTVNIVLPVFGMVLGGYALGRFRFFNEAGVHAMADFVYYVAIPVLLFHTLATTDIPEAGNFSITFAYYGATIPLYLLGAFFGGKVFGLSHDERGIFASTVTFSNTVLLGMPLILTAYGPAGLVPLFLIMGFQNACLLPVVTMYMELGRGNKPGWRLVLISVWSVLREPVVIAMAAGFGWRMAGLGLAQPVDAFAKLMSGAAAPVSLFALGASLALRRVEGDIKESITLAAVKLFVHPLMVWISVTYVFEMDPMWQSVAVIMAALPTAVMAFILAQRYDVYVARSTSATLISTGVSVVTLAALLTVLLART